MAVFLPDKVDFKFNNCHTDKEVDYIVIGSVYRADITMTDIYAFSTRGPRGLKSIEQTLI